jgi:hypothetical protein
MIDRDYLFFLSNIGNLVSKRVPPPKIYEFYHKKIEQNQTEKLKNLQIIFSEIHNIRKKLNFSDPNNLDKNLYADQLLIDLEKNIRIKSFKDEHEFLQNLKNILNFKLN